MTPFAMAQQAADIAYAMTLHETGDIAQASDDYRAVMDAYNKRVVYVQHANGTTESAPTTPDGWFINPATIMDEAQALADAKVAEYKAYYGLTQAEVDEINAKCAETEREEDYTQITEGAWK